MILLSGSFVEAEATMGIGNLVTTRRFVSRWLFAFSLLLAASIFLRVAMFVGTTTEARLLARRIAPQVRSTASQIQEKAVVIVMITDTAMLVRTCAVCILSFSSTGVYSLLHGVPRDGRFATGRHLVGSERLYHNGVVRKRTPFGAQGTRTRSGHEMHAISRGLHDSPSAWLRCCVLLRLRRQQRIPGIVDHWSGSSGGCGASCASGIGRTVRPLIPDSPQFGLDDRVRGKILRDWVRYPGRIFPESMTTPQMRPGQSGGGRICAMPDLPAGVL